MTQVICFRHPRFDPADAPDLSCRTCCQAYVDRIIENRKALQEQKKFNTEKWLEEKSRRQGTRTPTVRVVNGGQFHPGLI